MLFNSLIYLLFFLPVAVIIFSILKRYNTLCSKYWLIICSLFFYTWWNPPYLFLFIISIITNYACSLFLLNKSFQHKKRILYLGVFFNILLISYYKYADFIIRTGNQIFDSNISTLNIVLPLAISFFTFQQIAYLQDCGNERVKGTGFVDYLLFISFFPQLIAGPIVQFKEIVPQFHSKSFYSFNWDNLSAGLMLIGFGLAKKVLLADYFSIWANYGFNEVHHLTFLKSWITSLSYTLQLYFDFSGYTDMALGAALLFGIALPQNFNSPYKSLSIQAFWRRWHITLGRFLRDYIYIPLGGNRHGSIRTCLNLIFVFLIAGLWHGAGWTFIMWGLLHGVALVVHRIWRARNINIPRFIAWLITFLFINFTWIIFRASSLKSAIIIIKTMLTPDLIFNRSYITPLSTVTLGLLICIFAKNSDYYIQKKANMHPATIMIASLMTFAGLVTIIIWNANEFLYFQF